MGTAWAATALALPPGDACAPFVPGEDSLQGPPLSAHNTFLCLHCSADSASIHLRCMASSGQSSLCQGKFSDPLKVKYSQEEEDGGAQLHL